MELVYFLDGSEFVKLEMNHMLHHLQRVALVLRTLVLRVCVFEGLVEKPVVGIARHHADDSSPNAVVVRHERHVHFLRDRGYVALQALRGSRGSLDREAHGVDEGLAGEDHRS